MNALSERIRNCEFHVGDKLPTESEIMRTHEVSRTVVREAISRLQASGMVETHHGIGTFVRNSVGDQGFHIDPATIVMLGDVLAVLELRIGLETEAAGMAATRRTPEQLAEMRRALDAFQESMKQSSDTIAPDFQFHLQVVRATSNRYYIDILTHLGVMIIPRTRINSAQLARDDQMEYLNRINREHEDIYSAVARSDADAARAAMRTHLGNSRERIRRAHEATESATR